MNTELLQYTMIILGLGGVIFGIFKGVRDPQDKNELTDALVDKDLSTKATILAQKELETKALVLAEQVKNKDAENERRFGELGVRLDTAMTTAQNHIKTIDTKVDNLSVLTTSINLQMTKISTILEERLPKK